PLLLLLDRGFYFSEVAFLLEFWVWDEVSFELSCASVRKYKKGEASASAFERSFFVKPWEDV
ncbi:MAG TPA: hypothetical protein VK014_14305, partial [Cyclobacteriaceae bacterium]|nr:hypothetical protein [Cyclobacteriaceae bacterium]